MEEYANMRRNISFTVRTSRRTWGGLRTTLVVVHIGIMLTVVPCNDSKEAQLPPCVVFLTHHRGLPEKDPLWQDSKLEMQLPLELQQHPRWPLLVCFSHTSLRVQAGQAGSWARHASLQERLGKQVSCTFSFYFKGGLYSKEIQMLGSLKE